MLFWCQNKGKIKSKKSKMRKTPNKEMVIGSAIMICEKYLSNRTISIMGRYRLLDVLLENPDYCKDLVKHYNTEEKSKDIFISSISHDIAGLSKKDPHFLPRIS